MGAIHLHLILNHVPILGTIFGVCLFIYGLLFKNGSIKKAGLVVFVIVALISVLVFLSGKDAEKQVEGFPGIIHGIIQDHEEIAEAAFWMMEILGILSLAGLILSKDNYLYKYLPLVIIILSVVTMVTMIFVGYVGGMIQHTEIYNKAKISKYLELEPNDYDDD